MCRFIAAVLALSLLAGGQAWAQDPARRRAEADREAQGNLSPEMWAYLQELRRQDDPKMIARRAAMERGQQRRARLAAMQWYGYSNLRPTVNPTPMFGDYSPAWAGNSFDNTFWYPSYDPIYAPSYLRAPLALPSTAHAEQPAVFLR